jgi:hypothetical protein
MEVPMKRLKLENLEVESFETSKERSERGTVRGHQETYTDCPECYGPTYELTCDTCDYGDACGGSNAYTCRNWPGCDPSGQLIPTCQPTCYIFRTCPGYPTCAKSATDPCNAVAAGA